eukprot:6190473-Pleurochrysis_carterae.AAC.1
MLPEFRGLRSVARILEANHDKRRRESDSSEHKFHQTRIKDAQERSAVRLKRIKPHRERARRFELPVSTGVRETMATFESACQSASDQNEARVARAQVVDDHTAYAHQCSF